MMDGTPHGLTDSLVRDAGALIRRIETAGAAVDGVADRLNGLGAPDVLKQKVQKAQHLLGELHSDLRNVREGKVNDLRELAGR